MQRGRIINGPTAEGLRATVLDVAKGKLSNVDDIAAALRGY